MTIAKRAFHLTGWDEKPFMDSEGIKLTRTTSSQCHCISSYYFVFYDSKYYNVPACRIQGAGKSPLSGSVRRTSILFSAILVAVLSRRT